MTDKERLELINDKWGNYPTDTTKGMRELCLDFEWLLGQAEKVERYENIIHAIANIDTMFMLPDGTYRDFNDEEALREIEKMVMPIWNEHCEETRKRTEQMIQGWIK